MFKNEDSLWALVDANSFFASCEMVFRPDLKHRPVVVLSSNDGCLISANSAAKALGIKMFGPYFEVKKILQQHQAVVFSSNFPLYADMSRRINLTLSEFTPDMEIYSIDECFLNLSGIAFPQGIEAFGHKIKDVVKQHTHIGVGVGIAPTKVLAKLANHLAKTVPEFKQVTCLTDPQNRQLFLEQVTVEDIWGIGRKSAPKLRALGIRTAWDFHQFEQSKIIQKTLGKNGMIIQQELRGQSILRNTFNDERKKQIMCSRSFEFPKTEMEQLQQILAFFASDVTEKLRQQGSLCSMVTVFIQTSPFTQGPQYFNQNSIHFSTPTQDTRKVVRAIFELLPNLFQPGYAYKRAGVILDDLCAADNFQVSLFDLPDGEADVKLMQVMDKINRQEGTQTVKIAACGVANHRLSKKDSKSPAYTSRWTEIPSTK